MPKVSEEHLAARREQIVTACLVCFGRNGFHATTMADVIAESGLSAGAVYRYFRSKEELIEAISHRALDPAADALATVLADQDAPDLAEVVGLLLTTLEAVSRRSPVDLRRIAVQAWAEAVRSPAVAKVAEQSLGGVRSGFREVAVRGVRNGSLPSGADVDAVAKVLTSLMVGYAVQNVLFGDVSPHDIADGMRLLSGGAAVAT